MSDIELLLNPLTILSAMDDEYFESWLRFNEYGVDTGVYDKETLLGIFTLIQDESSLLSKQEIILQKLINLEKE